MNNADLLQLILPHLREPKLQKDGRFRAWCPFHPDGQGKLPHEPNLLIWPSGGFNCGVCHAKGNLWELAERLGVPVPSGDGHRVETEEEAMRLLTEGRRLSQSTIDFFRIKVDLKKQSWIYPSSLTDANAPYREKRFRPANATEKYWWPAGSKNRLYGLETIEVLGLYQGDAVLWANGEPAVWACFEAGVAAVCGLTGEGNVPPGVAEELRRRGVGRVLMPPDLDAAGEASVPKVLEGLAPLEIEVRRLPDHLGKGADLADLWKWCNAAAAFNEALEGLQAANPGEGFSLSPSIEKEKEEKVGLELIWAKDIELPKEGEGRGWWGPFLYPGSVHLVSGEAGVGKTTFFYALAIHAARGEEFLGIPFARPLRVLYLDLEMPSVLRARKLHLMSEGQPPDGLAFVPVARLDRDLLGIEAIVKEHNIDLVIVDTINEGFQTEDEDSNAEANRQMSLVRSLVRKTGCAVILITHSGKDAERKGVHKARGASARAAAADVVLNLDAIGEDGVRLEMVKNRWVGGVERLFIRKAGEDTFEVVEPAGEDTATGSMRAQQAILDYLAQAGEPRQRKDIQEALRGISRPVFDRALSAPLVQVGRLTRPRYGWYCLAELSPLSLPYIEEKVEKVSTQPSTGDDDGFVRFGKQRVSRKALERPIVRAALEMGATIEEEVEEWTR